MQITQIEQAKYILTALQGTFQAFQWRNHGGYDLDSQYIWWTADNALPPPQLALNFGRIKDPVIDKALADNRGATDPAQKKADAETVNKEFGTQCYNLWGSWEVWGHRRTLRTSWTSACSSTPTARTRAPGPVARSTSARSGSTPTLDATRLLTCREGT